MYKDFAKCEMIGTYWNPIEIPERDWYKQRKTSEPVAVTKMFSLSSNHWNRPPLSENEYTEGLKTI